MNASEILAAAGAEIIERDVSTIHVSIRTAEGLVHAIADLVRIGTFLVIDGVHVTGAGLTLRRIREVAKAFGQVEDVEEVIVQGGLRTSGARPGRVPSAIRIKVKS